MADKIKVIITNKQKTVKIPTGIRMLVRRCCNAVLKLENFEGPAEISVTFTDNAGIRELNSSANKGAIYNMNGVRVEKAKKGLYIKNGKKIFVK